MLSDLSNVLESSWFQEWINKVYVLDTDLYLMPLNMLLFTRTAAANLKYDMNVKFFCEENNDNNK